MLKQIVLFLVLTVYLTANNASYNQGKEFVFSFIPNYISTGADLFIYIVGQNDAEGVVEIPAIAYAKAFSIKKAEVLKIELPDFTDIFQKNPNKVVQGTVFVYASADISIYGFNRKKYTTDAFLALPKQSLGYEYIVSSYGKRLDQNYGGALNGVALVTAAYDNTKVVIVPNETSSGVYATDIPFEVELDRGDSYALYGGDVTGTHIRSTFPVSVMGGNECTFIPLETWACDHIVENEPPLSTWGKKYITVPFKGRKSDMFRITASQNKTILFINGEQVATLDKGEHYEDITPESMYIEGTNPILVTQFMLGDQWDFSGADPMMVVVPPYEQYMDEYFFSSLSKAENAQKNYVNVTIPTDAINSVVLDGKDINSSLFSPIQMTEYSSAQLPLESGSHHITASKPFGVVVYGMGAWESYGYTGGSAYRFINDRTDKYAPNIGLKNGVKRIHGIANDDEDINQNSVLEIEEDLNKNNKIDRRTEDINGNNILDEGEDEDGDDLIDIDGGIYSVTLDENATNNVQLNVEEYVPGSTRVEFTISLIDQNKPGSGSVVVSDGVGNISKKEFAIPILYHDVEVTSTLLVDGLTLDVNSFAVEPKSIITNGEKTEIVWKFDDFNMTQVENLDYEITLNDVLPGDTKIITQKLQVNYKDLRGKDINITLGEQHIKVLSPLANVIIDTDKDTYTSNQNVYMDLNVSNTNSIDYSLTAQISIFDASNILVSFVDKVDIAKLQSGNSVTFTTDWNTTDILAGQYQAKVELYDTNGNFVDVDSASFTIVSAYNANQTISLDSSTFGYEFKTTDTVIITNIIENDTLNTAYNDVSIEAVMTKPDGSKDVIYYTKALSPILPNGTIEEQINQAFVNAVPGVYSIETRLLDNGGKLLSMDTLSFELVAHQEDTLLGNTHALYPKVVANQAQECTDKVQNFGSNTLEGQQIRQRLFNLENGFVISESVSTYTLEANAGNAIELSRQYTHPLKEGTYSCLLEAMMGGTWVRLDNAVFEVEDGNQNNAGILVYTAKSDYVVDETIGLIQKVENYSNSEGTYHSRLEIIDADGKVVKILTSNVDNLEANAINTYQFDVNASSLGVGDFSLKAYLYDDTDNLVSQSSSTFKILAQAPVASLSVSVAKDVHYNTDLANIFMVATNHSAGQSLYNVNIRITVLDTQGLVTYEHNRSLGELVALEAEEMNEHFKFENLDEGLYKVQAELYLGSQLVSTSHDTFEVEKVVSNGLTGRIDIDTIIVAPGEDAVCHYSLINSGDVTYSNQEVKTLVIDANEQIVEEQTDYHNVEIKKTLSLDRTVQTVNLDEGSYRCQLEIKVDEQWRLLDTKSFTIYEQVTVLPTQIEEHNESKILILLDETFCTQKNSSTPKECTNADPYGPDNAPTLDKQRAYLEKLLKANDYKYEIVTDSQSFMYALRTGAYESYVILSEQLDLSKEAQKELREAVYKGENIFFAGTHYRKNIYLLTALGIDIKGECKEASGYSISGSNWLQNRSDDFVLRENVLHVVDRGASVIGNYVNCDCSTYTTAVTDYTYGLGHTIFVGFDLLAQATKAEEQSSYRALFLEILKTVVPTTNTYAASSSVSLKLPLSVEEGTSKGVMKLETNKGRLSYDKDVIQKRGKMILMPLEFSGSNVEHFYIHLPEDTGGVEVKATLQSLAQTDSSEQEEIRKTLEIQHLYSYDELLSMLNGVKHSVSSLDKIKTYLNKAKATTNNDEEIVQLVEASNVFESLHSNDEKLIRARVMLGHLLRYAQNRQISFIEHMSHRLDVQDSKMIDNHTKEFEFIKHLDPAFKYLKKDK